MNVDKIQDIVNQDDIVFLSYGGFLTQALISAMTEALEKEALYNNINMSIANNIFTIFIEMSQNIMNYAKSNSEQDKKIKSTGIVIVGRDDGVNYYIHSQNIINKEDKEKIEPKLQELKTLTKDEIKTKYRELRRSGKDSHGQNAGIGFYEIAKKSSKIDYEFKKINENKYQFHFISKIKTKKEH